MQSTKTKTCSTTPKLLTFDVGSGVLGRACGELSQHDHFRYHLDSIFIDYQKGRLIITGRLPSFYLKQMLQTVLRTLPEVQQIDNRVDVVSSRGLSSIPRPAERSSMQ